MSADAAYTAMLAAGTDLVAGVPDSLLAPLHHALRLRREIRYVPCCDEATAVGIAAGAALAGARSLVVMENSGLRRACESLSRFVLGHRLHTVLLVSHRGAFGEANWWGIGHSRTMRPHVEMLGIASTGVDRIPDFGATLAAAFAMHGTGQVTACIIASPSFCAELREPADADP